MRRQGDWIFAATVLVATAIGLSMPIVRAGAGDLPRSTPEEQGVSSAAISALVDALDKIDQVHSVMLVRHGYVVAEGWWGPYAADIPHTLYSLSKSFTSTAVGMAIEEGDLLLDDPVLDFFPNWGPPEPSEFHRAMRVRDLLNMNTGQHGEEINKVNFVDPGSPTKAFLQLPVAHRPGTHFVYNTPATYVCSAIVTRSTGQTVNDYLRSRLYEPLGIAMPRWDESNEGVSLGGFGLHLRTEDVAKFGQLYLQRGRWGAGADARQLIPAAWVDLATSRQTSTGSNPDSDWDQGYGYQFWRCRPLHVYRGDGAFGQFCIVMPDQDAVLAITSGTNDLQGVLNAVWTKLLPALASGDPLPADAGARAELVHRLGELQTRAVEGNATSPVAERVSGKSFTFAANERKVERLALRFTPDGGTTIALRAGGADYELAGVGEKWSPSAPWPRLAGDLRNEPAANPSRAVGAWTADDAYVVKVVHYETPYSQTWTCRFAADGLTLTIQDNVSFGPNQPTTLRGAESQETGAEPK